jgi:hypothetical protein
MKSKINEPVPATSFPKLMKSRVSRNIYLISSITSTGQAVGMCVHNNNINRSTIQVGKYAINWTASELYDFVGEIIMSNE